MTKHTKILWVDLEMTGLDPRDDRIMEVAAIVTDWDFSELATYEGVIKVGDDVIESRMRGPAAGFWDANPTARDGLVMQNATGKSATEIEDELLKFLDENFDDATILLAGNSIHQDRRFIRHEWPRVDARLSYRMLDVSAWKVVFEGKYRKKFAKPEEHRALGDIRGSIMELQYYLKKVKA